jgi:hypothetical protein
MDIDEVADELYGLDPAEFVETRKARVTQARKEGDRELATAIGKMRKPTLVASVVNNLAREEPEQVEELLGLGEALRDAQRHLSGDDLRALTTQRQRVIRAMARRAGELAAARGQKMSETAAREVGQSLHAALADPEIADLVRAGRLVTAASYSGMGPAGMTVIGGGSTPTTSGKNPDTTKQKAEAQAEVDAAERAELQAREAVGTAQADAQEAADRVAELDSRIEDLRGQLTQAEQERQFAHKSERAAASNVTAAEHKAEHAQARLVAARKKLDNI